MGAAERNSWRLRWRWRGGTGIRVGEGVGLRRRRGNSCLDPCPTPIIVLV